MSPNELLSSTMSVLEDAMTTETTDPLAPEWEHGKTWRELIDIHVGHLLAGEADHHGVRSRPIKTVLDQAERDLAAARADAARYRAALETVVCVDEDEEIPRGTIVCGEEYDGRIAECVNCIARAALDEGQ